MKLLQYKPFIFTEDPDTLVAFYTTCLGMRIVRKLEYELDYGYTLELHDGGPQIWLAKHSEVSGKNTDTYRHILNIYVDSVQAFFDAAKEYPRTVVVAEPFAMGDIVPGETRYACTILDPEGNCLQFMGPL